MRDSTLVLGYVESAFPVSPVFAFSQQPLSRRSTRPFQPLRKLHHLDLVTYWHIHDGDINDVEPVGDPGHSLVTPDRGQPLSYGFSYSVPAVTSTVCDTSSLSLIVTRHDRTAMAASYHIRFMFAIAEIVEG